MRTSHHAKNYTAIFVLSTVRGARGRSAWRLFDSIPIHLKHAYDWLRHLCIRIWVPIKSARGHATATKLGSLYGLRRCGRFVRQRHDDLFSYHRMISCSTSPAVPRLQRRVAIWTCLPTVKTSNSVSASYRQAEGRQEICTSRQPKG